VPSPLSPVDQLTDRWSDHAHDQVPAQQPGGRRSRWRRLPAVLAVGAIVAAGLGACAPAPVAKPATPTFSPSAGIEPTVYEAAAKPCDPADSYDKPGPIALRNLLNATYGTIAAGITRTCDGSVSEHAEGRALDWMADYANADQRAKALAVIEWMRATDAAGNTNAVARRLGIEYWIYNKQMYGSWNNFNPTPYSCAGDATSCHVNHIHFSFTWAGAYKQVSFWRGSTLPTVPTNGSSFVVDSRSPAPALSTTQLAAGRTYTLEVSGTYRFGPVSSQTADAECSISGLTWMASRSAAPYGSSVLDLKIGGGSIGGTTWTPVTDTGGGCNTRDHRYRMTVRPRSAMPITGLILDGRADNSGALTVKILPAS
jgi:hypothetical protein